MLQQEKNPTFLCSYVHKKPKWLFTFFYFLEHLLVDLFFPTAYTRFGLEPSNHTMVHARKNCRIYVPADSQMHQHSPSTRKMWLSFSLYSHSLNTKQTSRTTSWGELNYFENRTRKFKPKIPKYAAVGCFRESVQNSLLLKVLTPGKC